MKSEDITVFASPSFDSLTKTIFEAADFSEISKTLGIERKKYFLITSGARWMKNALRAVLAFDALFHDGKLSDMKVVITGVTDKHIFEKRIKHKEKFAMTGFVERDELEALNKNAYCFVFPTLNEAIWLSASRGDEICDTIHLLRNGFNARSLRKRRAVFQSLFCG